MSQLGHSRPSRLARNAPYDRSCFEADIRRAPTELLLKIKIGERPPAGVLHDEAGVVALFDGPGRRERAEGMGRCDDSTVRARANGRWLC